MLISVVRQAGNWITYEPPAGFTDADAFAFAVNDGLGGVASGTATVGVNASVPARYDLRITDLGNGSSQLDFSGIPGRSYTVQYATSLPAADWQTLGVVTADAAGSCGVVDASGNAGQRIYRACGLP